MVTASTPSPASRWATSGCRIWRLISVLSFAISSRGVAAGANVPYQPLASKPLIVSATVGSSGTAAERFALVTATARNLPDFTCGIADSMLLNISDTWPASRSIVAGAAPLYGICVSLTPAIMLKSSPARCGMPPVLADA